MIQEERIQVEQREEMLFFEFMKGTEYGADYAEGIDEEVFKAWADILPFMEEHLCIDRNDRKSFSVGFAISRRDAEYFGFSGLKVTMTIPECLCATCVLKGDQDEMIMVRKIDDAIRRIEEKGYLVVGDIIVEVYDYARVDGKYQALHRCFFPIEI